MPTISLFKCLLQIVKRNIGKSLIDDFVVEEQKSQARKFVRLGVSKPFEVDIVKKTERSSPLKQKDKTFLFQ